LQAAILTGTNKLELKKIDKPKVQPGSILIKILSCGVCGSDIRIFKSGNNRVKYPAIIGHEIAGEIVEIGKGVHAFWQIGDKVAIGADVPCGSCNWCQNGIANCCDKNYAMGYQFSGGYAEYCLLEPMVVKYGPITKISSDLDPDIATMSEPLACSINAFERVYFSLGKSVLIIGSGPIGIMLALLAKTIGASLITIADIDKERLASAGTIAEPDQIINSSNEDLVKSGLKITKNQGFDAIFTACQSPEIQEQAMQLVAKRGFVNLFAGLPKTTRAISISSNNIHYKEAYITGSHGSTPRQHKTAVELIESKRINLAPLITHKFSLKEINKAFETASKKIGLRIIVKP